MVERCLVAVGILHFPVAQAPDENIIGFLQGMYFLRVISPGYVQPVPGRGKDDG